MRITGQVINVRPVKGTDESTNTPYSYNRANVLDEDSGDIIDCRVGDDFGPISPGEVVTAVVTATPYKRDGRAAVSVRLVANLGALAPSGK